jgi:hypothetical protein
MASEDAKLCMLSVAASFNWYVPTSSVKLYQIVPDIKDA